MWTAINQIVILTLFTDYSKGFGGKYGVEKEKVDKAALGYDYKCQTEKHQSQKGEFKSFKRYLTQFVWNVIYFNFCLIIHQIMQKDLEENTGWRQRKWTKLLWDTTIKEKLRSTSHRKVS